jgi:hypothetical protein
MEFMIENVIFRYITKASRCPDPIISETNAASNFSVVSENLERIVRNEEKHFKDVVYYKAMNALSSPGDAVGVLAAQVDFVSFDWMREVE